MQAQKAAALKQEQLEKENYEKLMKSDEDGAREKRKSESEDGKDGSSEQGVFQRLQ